jgi:hypothetical protein
MITHDAIPMEELMKLKRCQPYPERSLADEIQRMVE